MIIKSYEIKKNLNSLSSCNYFLLYGENYGLKKDIRDFIHKSKKKSEEKIESLTIYENEILNNEQNFYDFVFSGSLFSSKKIVTIQEASDKLIKKIENVCAKSTKDVFLIIFANTLDKKSKLRNFFETKKNTICIPCYLDSEKNLQIIASNELKERKIKLSVECVNLLIEKSNSDRNNLKNEIEKIDSYLFDKEKIDIEQLKSLLNFSGDYKSELLINECLSCNITEYKKIVSEFYESALNQIFLLRILSNKVQRLIKIKEDEDKSTTIDNLINSIKPAIFWKEKPIVKKQLLIWNIHQLKKIINEINSVELLCKKNPDISNSIFFGFFSKICFKSNNFS